MNIPRDNETFYAWASSLSYEQLAELEIELSRRITSCELQLADTAYKGHTREWKQKATVALKFDQWRLDSTRRLAKLRSQFDSRFVQEAKRLLDPDTFGVIAAEASGNQSTNHAVMVRNGSY